MKLRLIKNKIKHRIWMVENRVCSWLYWKVKKKSGIGDEYSNFWYGLEEGLWTVVCGSNLRRGIQMTCWIWKGCPKRESLRW